MPQTHARTLVALSTLAALSFAVPAGSIAPAPPSPAAPPAASAQVSAAAPQLRHAQAAALLAQLRSDLVDLRTHLSQMRLLVIKSLNGLLSQVERLALDAEFQQHLSQLQQLALASQSSGVQLLDGSQPSVELQIDPSLPQLLTLWLPDCTPMSLGIDWLDVTSTANAASAHVACDAALDVAESSLAATRAAALALGL